MAGLSSPGFQCLFARLSTHPGRTGLEGTNETHTSSSGEHAQNGGCEPFIHSCPLPLLTIWRARAPLFFSLSARASKKAIANVAPYIRYLPTYLLLYLERQRMLSLHAKTDTSHPVCLVCHRSIQCSCIYPISRSHPSCAKRARGSPAQSLDATRGPTKPSPAQPNPVEVGRLDVGQRASSRLHFQLGVGDRRSGGKETGSSGVVSRCRHTRSSQIYCTVSPCATPCNSIAVIGSTNRFQAKPPRRRLCFATRHSLFCSLVFSLSSSLP